MTKLEKIVKEIQRKETYLETLSNELSAILFNGVDEVKFISGNNIHIVPKDMGLISLFKCCYVANIKNMKKDLIERLNTLYSEIGLKRGKQYYD